MPRHTYDPRRGRSRPVANITADWTWLIHELQAARNRGKPVAPAVRKRRYQDNRSETKEAS